MKAQNNQAKDATETGGQCLDLLESLFKEKMLSPAAEESKEEEKGG